MKLKKKTSVLRRKKPNLDRSLRPELTFYTQPINSYTWVQPGDSNLN